MIFQKKFFIFLFFLLIFFLFVFIFLEIKYVKAEREVEIEYPEIKGLKITTIKTPLPQYIKYLFFLVISIAGLTTFAVLIYGGVRWLTSAGNPATLTDAKDQIFSGILGLIILLSSWLFLNTINPELIIFKAPEELETLNTPKMPELEDGDVCLLGENGQKLNCFNEGGGSALKPTKENVKSIQINKQGLAIGLFESPYWKGKRICFKDSVSDLTQYNFGKGADLTDDINSVYILKDEQCCHPGIVLSSGEKNNFCGNILVYKNKDYKPPVILIFSKEGDGISSDPPDVVKSIWIEDGPLAVRLFSEPDYGANGGKTICFIESVPDLSKYTCEGWWVFRIGWDIRIRSIKIINDNDCPKPGKTETID